MFYRLTLIALIILLYGTYKKAEVILQEYFKKYLRNNTISQSSISIHVQHKTMTVRFLTTTHGSELSSTLPYVVMLPGSFASSICFAETAQYLFVGYNVIVIDIPGWGVSDTPHPIEQFSAEEYKDFFNEFLYTFLKEMHISSCILVGQSLSSYFAVLFAHRYPEKIDKLVLQAPVGILPLTNMTGFLYMLLFRTSLHHHLIRWLYPIVHPIVSSLTVNKSVLYAITHMGLSNVPNKHVIRKYTEMIRWKYPCFNELMSIQAPVYLLYGENDSIVPKVESMLLSKTRNPYLKSMVIPNSSHNVHRHSLFNPILYDILQTQENISIPYTHEPMDLSPFNGSLSVSNTKTCIRYMYWLIYEKYKISHE